MSVLEVLGTLFDRCRYRIGKFKKRFGGTCLQIQLGIIVCMDSREVLKLYGLPKKGCKFISLFMLIVPTLDINNQQTNMCLHVLTSSHSFLTLMSTSWRPQTICTKLPLCHEFSINSLHQNKEL